MIKSSGAIAIFLSIVLGVVFAVAGVCYFTSPAPKPENGALVNNDLAANSVQVGELFDSATGRINIRNRDALFSYLGGYSNINYTDGTYNSSNVLTGSTNQGVGNNRRYNDNGTYKSIVVTVCGLQWILTWITTASSGDTNIGNVDADHDGNPDKIACLWLSDCKQSAWNSATLDSKYGNYAAISSSGSLTSQYATWYDGGNQSAGTGTNPDQYPCDMYGTSFIRAATLNNGGMYSTSGGAVATTATWDQDENNPFAKFTMSTVTGNITNFIVAPKYVYVVREQHSTTQFTWDNDPANGALNGDNQLISDGTATGTYNKSDYPEREGYDAWADDYLWIPSIFDTGAGMKNNVANGYWADTAIEQKATSATWMRTSRDKGACKLHIIPTSGSSGTGETYNKPTNELYGVRPAFFLNLSLLNKGNGANITATSSSSTSGSVTATGYRPDSPNTAQGIYEYAFEAEGTLTAIPNTGYAFAYWLKDGAFFSGNTANPLSITADANATYIAVFYSEDLMFGIENLQDTVAVMLETQGSNITTIAGSVDILGYTKFNGLDSVNVAATPAEGFEFVGWKINGSKTLSSTYTDDAVSIALTDLPDIKLIVAVFRPITT